MQSPQLHPSSTSTSTAATAVAHPLVALQTILTTPLFRHDPASGPDRDATRRLATAVGALDDWAVLNKWTEPPAPGDLARFINDAQFDTLNQLLLVADSLVQDIDTVQEDVAAVRVAVDTIATDLDTARASATQFIRVAADQEALIDSVTNQQKQIANFLAEYTPTPLETAELSSPSLDLSESFFAAFDRALTIADKARTRLDFPNTPLSNDIVTTMDGLLDAAYNRLYSWAQSRLPTFSSISPDVPLLLPMAMTRLTRGRPILADTLLDEAIAHRRAAVARWFADTVMTRGSAPPPLSHTSSVMVSSSPSSPSSRRGSMVGGTSIVNDTDRQVGDVFAWVHQAVSAELALWTTEVGPNGIIPRTRAITLVDTTLDVVVRPIIARVETVVSRASLPTAAAGDLMSAVDTVAAYRVYHVLGVNRDVMLKILPRSSSLVEVTYELQRFCLRQFKDALDMQAQMLRTAQDTVDPATLRPLPIVEQTVQSLITINLTRDRYLRGGITSERVSHSPPPTDMGLDNENECEGGGGDHPNKSGTLEHIQLRSILDMLIDPCLQSCVVASTNKALKRVSSSVFVINCLTMLKDAIKSLSPDKALTLDKQIEIYMDSLVSEQFAALIHQSGMQVFADKLERQTDMATLSNMGIDVATLHGMLIKLDALLMTGAHREMFPDLMWLTSTELADQVVTRGNVKFMEVYTRLCQALTDDPKSSEVFSGVVMRSVEEVESLLRV